MKISKTNFIHLVFAVSINVASFAQSNNKPLELWYNQPANDWMTEALPIGNGYIGAMFFGDTAEEHIQFSEGTLWSGGPDSNPNYNFGLKKDVHKNLPKIRILLNEGKIKEADKLAKAKFPGKIDTGKKYNSEFGDYGAQQTMGDIFIKVKHNGKVSNYKRSLNISNSLGKVNYEIDGEKYSRVFFRNYPKNVLVYQFKSTKKTNYEICFKTPHVRIKEGFKNGIYSFQGKVADNGMGFETKLQLKLTDGSVSYKNGVLSIKNTNEFTILHASATSYLLKYPTYSGNNFLKKNKQTLKVASALSFEKLKEEHIADYTNLLAQL